MRNDDSSEQNNMNITCNRDCIGKKENREHLNEGGNQGVKKL